LEVFVIIFMAGRGHGAAKMKHRAKYEHVLFSFFEYSTKNFKWLKRRKEAHTAVKARKKK